tara:strand:+ start:276 stop:611 length:336 start_codon:yes stop_codon:yes gene_type:complete
LFEQIVLYLYTRNKGVIMAKKTKTVKFTKEELESLQNLKNDYNNIQNELGRVSVLHIQTEQRLEDLENNKIQLEVMYKQTQQKESDLVGELTEKYGVGNLDINTGKFTPVK